MNVRAAWIAVCLTACAASERGAEPETEPAAPQAVVQNEQLPANLEDVLRHYQAASGYNITYDSDTAALLQGLRITPVGTPDLRVLKVAPLEGHAAAQPTEPVSKVFALQFAAAPEMAETLNGLIVSASGGPSSKIRINADERTNSLLVSASPARMAELEALIGQLDVRAE